MYYPKNNCPNCPNWNALPQKDYFPTKPFIPSRNSSHVTRSYDHAEYFSNAKSRSRKVLSPLRSRRRAVSPSPKRVVCNGYHKQQIINERRRCDTYNKCRTYGAQITLSLSYNSPYGLPY